MYAYEGHVVYVRPTSSSPFPDTLPIHSERRLFVEGHDTQWLKVATYAELAAELAVEGGEVWRHVVKARKEVEARGAGDL